MKSEAKNHEDKLNGTVNERYVQEFHNTDMISSKGEYVNVLYGKVKGNLELKWN